MLEISAVYQIPDLEDVFFIVSDLCESEQHDNQLQEKKKEMECLERTVKRGDYIWPIVPPQWKQTVISEQDFLTILENTQPIKIKAPIQASTNLEKMSFLSIQATAPRSVGNDPYLSFKFLTYLPQDDVIELFI